MIAAALELRSSSCSGVEASGVDRILVPGTSCGNRRSSAGPRPGAPSTRAPQTSMMTRAIVVSFVAQNVKRAPARAVSRGFACSQARCRWRI